MIIINGYVSQDQSIMLDSGFHFGRGVFETIMVKNKPLFLTEHCKRLTKGLNTLKIINTIDEDYVARCIEQYNINNCILKIGVSEKNVVITTRQLTYKPEDYIRGFKIKLSTLKRNPYSHVTYLKSLNNTDNILEKEQANKEGYDEVLFLNIHNELAEGSISNVFFVKGNRIFTPKVNCGILDGIVRGWILDNFDACTGKYSLEDVKKADEVFVSNSIMGIMKVNFIEGIKTFVDDNIYGQVRDTYEKYVDRL